MKTYKHLTENALTDEAMNKALNKAIQNKRYREDVQDVIEHKDEMIPKIREDFYNGNFPILVHKTYVRKDGIKKKERNVTLPFFTKSRPEQWLQHIIMGELAKVIQKGMYIFCCGSVPKRGNYYGKKYLEKYIRNNNVRYCLKLDAKHFYDSINTDILKYKFERIIKDKIFLKAVYWLLDNNISVKPDGTILSKGLRVGFYPSQWLANFFLQDLDHYAKENLKVDFYMRYMDDIVILGTNKKELRKALEKIRGFLKSRDLELKSNYQIFKFDYINKNGKRVGRFIDFMGFKFYRDKTTIRKSIFLRACRAGRNFNKGYLTRRKISRVLSYKGWFDKTNTHNAYKKYIVANVSINACKNFIRKSDLKHKEKGVKNGI